MKKTAFLLSIVFAVLVLGSCTYHHHSQAGALPPGQAKKVAGSKSAKAYAPGQQKKH